MNAKKNGQNLIEPNRLQKDCVTPGMSDPRNRTSEPAQA
jgi:hypothetical protein